MNEGQPTLSELSRRLHEFRDGLIELRGRIDKASETDQTLSLALGKLMADFEHLEEDIDDLEGEVKELKRARVESRKWAIPVGISIITLLVLVISNTLSIIYR